MKRFETKWTTDDHLEIFAQGWEPDQRAPKAAICLVHGLGEHSGRYEHVAEAFTKDGYAMFGFDLRGHGRSGGPRGHFPSSEAVLQDIDLLFTHARERYPELPLILYGHSLGGILVLYYGLKRKPKVKGVIATSPGLHTALESQTGKIIAAQILGLIAPTVLLPSGLDAHAISHTQAVIDKYQQDPLVHDKISLGFGRTMLGVTKWTLEHAAEFPAPLLLMHGKEDRIAFPSSSIEFAAAAPEKSTLVLWDEGYHELHNEPEQAEVLKTMLIWMNARLNE
ncbi:MAG: lysophospholipase [Anaerolineales bacterium]|nr:lysophospholipase [Anaerolineales bacterium]MCZ2121494.1 alpha/beta hydrolase [Anaerolineales bacterium]